MCVRKGETVKQHKVFLNEPRDRQKFIWEKTPTVLNIA